MTAQITVSTEKGIGVAVLHLKGHLGIESHRTLKEACEQCLLDPSVHELRLDCAHIQSTDATVLGMLLVLRERGHAVHKNLSLSHCDRLLGGSRDLDRIEHFFTIV